MAIYRGPGGAGDATTDSSTEAAAALAAAAEAEVSATSAANSATSASNSATTATTQATNASNSATAAASSASAASTSASNASTSATNAASSATTATTKASEASSSATAAASSASAASTSATNAASSASAASTSATNAASSATSAANSATTATTQATNASNSATAADSSATSAASSASTATTQASNAATSATAAAASASTATTKASEAATSATNAATSATNAANSATAAATSATNASNSASAASTSATNAASSATSAASSASAAAASYDSFDDRYLGSKSSAPTLDNDGNALLTGALYFDTTSNSMKVYNGTAWLDAYASLSGALLATNNLSDLNSVSTARTNLGLGTAALVADDTLVHLAGTETITGDKTFSSTITGSITGNAGTVTNGVYTSGSYADPTWLTSIAGSKVSGNISGNAATATTATNQSGGTVAATTGSFSSSVTLSGGTANGVPYLNGSKVLTTGSELTFDGTALAPDGTSRTLGTASLRWGTVFATALSDGTDQLVGSAGASARFGFGASWTSLAFAVGGSEQMRLTSTGLGIGTSSPSQKLHVSGRITCTGGGYTINPSGAVFGDYTGGAYPVAYIQAPATGGISFWKPDTSESMRIDSSGNVGIGTSSPAVSGLQVSRTGTASVRVTGGSATYTGVDIIQDAAGTAYLWNRDNTALIFGTNNTEKMQISSSGNLGLGVTPSAWQSTWKALEMQGGSLMSPTTNYIDVVQNAYHNGTSWIYKNTAAATNYVQGGGSHSWNTAPSGTAGNAISFTQAMTLDASGNLGIGTSSPGARLDVNGGRSYFAANNEPYSIYLRYNGSTSGFYIGSPSADAMTFSASSGAERMRIDSSGNVGIGTTSIAQKLTVNGGLTANNWIGYSNTTAPASDCFIYRPADNTLGFGTATAERMRIDSSGVITSGLGGMQVISGTSVSASGTAVAFTGIPSWVKRITLMLSGISTTGTSQIIVQLGTGSTPTYTTSGYLGCISTQTGSTVAAFSTSFIVSNSVLASDSGHCKMYIDNLTGNQWMESSLDANAAGSTRYGAGTIALGSTLTALRVTTVNGTDTFDSGTINILYE